MSTRSRRAQDKVDDPIESSDEKPSIGIRQSHLSSKKKKSLTPQKKVIPFPPVFLHPLPLSVPHRPIFYYYYVIKLSIFYVSFFLSFRDRSWASLPLLVGRRQFIAARICFLCSTQQFEFIYIFFYRVQVSGSFLKGGDRSFSSAAKSSAPIDHFDHHDKKAAASSTSPYALPSSSNVLALFMFLY